MDYLWVDISSDSYLFYLKILSKIRSWVVRSLTMSRSSPGQIKWRKNTKVKYATSTVEAITKLTLTHPSSRSLRCPQWTRYWTRWLPQSPRAPMCSRPCTGTWRGAKRWAGYTIAWCTQWSVPSPPTWYLVQIINCQESRVKTIFFLRVGGFNHKIKADIQQIFNHEFTNFPSRILIYRIEKLS